MDSQPLYELRAINHAASDLELEVWQLPSSATPNLKQRLRIAGLRGRNIALVEHRVLKRLKERGIEVSGLLPGTPMTWRLPEDLALNLGILFRVLNPLLSSMALFNLPFLFLMTVIALLASGTMYVMWEGTQPFRDHQEA